MSDGWKRERLGDIAEVLLGKMLDQKKNRGELLPFLNNVSVRWGGFDLSDIGKMRFESDELERYQIRKGDIVVCEGGESGRCAMWKNEEPILYQKALHRVRAKNGVDQRFLYYQLFDAFRNGKADALITGSTIKHLPRQAMLQVPLSLPPLPTQRRIAAVLGALDDKIELNRKMNANLEAQAQALFKSWFVDFDPWGGKMPSGWKMGRLGEIVEVCYGKDHKKLAEGAIPVFGSGGLMRYAELALYDKESVLIPRKGSLNNIMYSADPFWTVDTMFYTKMRIENAAKFLYLFLRGKDMAAMNTGSAVPSMTTDILNSMEIVFPPSKELASFETRISPMFKMHKSNARESRKLAELRDSLLPKLMSGELEVA